MTQPSFDGLRPSPVTLSQELFSSHSGHNTSAGEAGSLQDLHLLTALPNSTVNPASLSPTMTPVPEADEEDEELATGKASIADAATLSQVTSADATQHPAAMLCSDLPCRLAEAPPSEWLASSQQPLHPALALIPIQTFLISTWTALTISQRPLTQIAMSLKGNFSLPSTPAILKAILLLVTRALPLRTSSPTRPTTTLASPSSNSHSLRPLTASSTTRRSSSLRLKFLRKILTCSPSLARPLMDATMAALRLVSTEDNSVDWVGDGASSTAAARGHGLKLQHDGGAADWLNGVQLPSKEVLLTLLWVLRTEERKREGASSQPGRPGDLSETSAPDNGETFVLKSSSKRRLEGKAQGFPDFASLKRRRVSE
jgi:transcriptional activator HAC1